MKSAASNTDPITQRATGLNDQPLRPEGNAVVYLMSRDQRLEDNHALLLAQAEAKRLELPLTIVFVLRHQNGHRAFEHYAFMIEGLRELAQTAARLHISFQLVDAVTAMKAFASAAAVYTDFSPLRGARRWQERLAQKLHCPVVQVDTHNIVPVWVASDKQEFAARTLRSKINRLLPDFLISPGQLERHPYGKPETKIDEEHIQQVLAALRRNGQKLIRQSGEKAAHAQCKDFIKQRLDGYAERRNDPVQDGLSGLSPYMHFGQISSLRVALEVMAAKNERNAADFDAFLEELIVRKELSDNFCYYNTQYDNLAGAPDWAKATLAKHAQDERAFIYSRQELADGLTHDAAWNASQQQLKKTGKMHGYMRMYWAKKVLEWSESPEQAIEHLIYLNDFYSIDGADSNGYVGILWSVAGLHDRPWFERPIFGTVRYMNENGLRRKFALDDYIQKFA